MRFENENELQKFISESLSNMGVPNHREVQAVNGGRIDILSDRYAIEVKPKLNRSALFQASGQLSTYASSFPGRKLVIAGLSPNGEEALRSAQSTARRIQDESNIEVWFIDNIEQFKLAYGHQGKQQPPMPETIYSSYDADWKAYLYPLLGALTAVVVGIVALAGHGMQQAELQANNVANEQLTAPRVSNDLLRTRSVTVGSQPVNIRLSPSTTAAVIGTAKPGDRLNLTGNQAANTGGSTLWLEVLTAKGDRAWVVGGAVQ